MVLDTDLASQYTTLWLYKIQGGSGSGSSTSNWSSWAWTYQSTWGTTWGWVSTEAAWPDAVSTQDVTVNWAITSNNNTYAPSWGRKALWYAWAALTVPFLWVPWAIWVYKYITK